jgi:hypothetical protein
MALSGSASFLCLFFFVAESRSAADAGMSHVDFFDAQIAPFMF